MTAERAPPPKTQLAKKLGEKPRPGVGASRSADGAVARIMQGTSGGVANTAVKGRGAAENPTGRYEPLQLCDTSEAFAGEFGEEFHTLTIADGDELHTLTIADGDESRQSNRGPATSWQWDASRSVINTVTSPDISFALSINPYRGCEHGCTYCYARPSHAWLGLSPGLDFETRLFAKRDAARLLRGELRRRGYRPQTIAIGFNTDAWQPLEKELRITRSILEVLLECRNPAAVISKSTLILRDKELLAEMAALNLVHVSVSITTLDAALNARMEPRAASPAARLKVVRQLAELGVPVRVMVAPVIPGLTDHELESILQRAAEAGAVGAGYVLLRLPHELAQLFPAWLERHYPRRAKKVLSAIGRARGGKLNSAVYHDRMRGQGQEAELLAQRFRVALARFGLQARADTIADLDASGFRPPALAEDSAENQPSLF